MSGDQCPECHSNKGWEHAQGCGRTATYSFPDKLYKMFDSQEKVRSCPECGVVADIDYETVKDKEADCQAYGDNPLIHHMKATFNTCVDIAIAKNEGYAGNDDPMANFKDSVRLGVPVPIGIAIRLSDKWARLCRQLLPGDHDVMDESIADTILDSIDYLAILLYALESE